MNATTLAGRPLHHPDNVLDLIEPWLETDRPAVVDPRIELSYRDLDTMSASMAAELIGRGVAVGDPVLVHARLSAWAVAAMLGVLRAGARYVAVDADFPAQRQQAMVAASGAAAALIEPGLARPAVGDSGDGSGSGSSAGGGDGGRGAATRRGPLAYTCFTSGSTGRPRAVTVPSAALAYSTAARLAYYAEPVTGFLLCSSISFDSSVAGIYWTLSCGGLLAIPSDRPADLAAMGRFADRYRCSHLLMVPSLYAVALAGGVGGSLGSLSTVVVAGEDCPPGLVARHFETVPGARLYNEYGPTECTVWSTVHHCVPADALGPRVPIGRPIPGTAVSVPSTGVGELSIGGPGVADGGIYRTGDLVSLRGDGALLFHGRIDHQLKLGGVRVERAEIEHAVMSFPAVTQAAVAIERIAGATQVGGRPRLVGFVVADGAIDRPALRRHLLARLPAVAVPARIEVVSSLPRQPNGKVDHRAIDRLAGQLPPVGGPPR
ncbi:MAG TPA: AMP-binding protein [Rugosimonospora sp.]